MDGDRSVKIDVERSIELYRESLALDPQNHLVLWKLSWAHEKKEDWSAMEAVLARAVALAPSEAKYRQKLGYALVMQGQEGDRGAFERAMAPLQECVELDGGFAECHYLLGEACRAVGDEAGALESYQRAIEHDPKSLHFYLPLAELHLKSQKPEQAAAILKQGTGVATPDLRSRHHFYAAHVLSALAAQARRDEPGLTVALDNVRLYETHPPLDYVFRLGAALANQKPTRHKVRAVELLRTFTDRACRRTGAARSDERCGVAAGLLKKLGA
jgi:tetratricopeptide (TPR) repeat protein